MRHAISLKTFHTVQLTGGIDLKVNNNKNITIRYK